MNNDFDFSWDKLSENLQSNMNSGAFKKFEADKRFWKLSKNEDGNGAAVIRLLPDKDNKPFIKMLHYGMNKINPQSGKKMWFIANSPESIGAPCPIKEHYMSLMAEGTTEASEEAKKFKRQTKFIANIMVVKDPSNPSSEGEIFLWEFGTKMKDRIMSWLQPSQEELSMGEEAKALYNPVEGFSIKLKIQKQGDFFTYDGTSLMGSTSSVFNSVEEAKKAINTKTHALSEFLQPEYYDEYTILKDRLNKFIGGSTTPSKVANTTPNIKDDTDEPEKSIKVVESIDVDDSEDWLDQL